MRGRTIELEVTDKRGKAAKTIPLYQYDYGQKLLIKGVELPEYYEVHFSNQQYGDAITVLGDSTGVLIPDSLVATGETIYVWLFLHDTSYDGETEYMGAIPVIKRAQPTDVTPTPEEQSIITEVIAALNNMEDDMSEQVQAAEAAKEAAQTAQTVAEGAATTASGYVDTVTAAQTAAEAAQAAAETAATSATASATSATSSANSANNALAEATNAKIAAVDAASAASTSATTATTASGNASNYATSAESAKVDAVAAQTAAEAAQTAAETAQGKAEDAQGAAETAQTAAEAAQTAAEAAQTAAETAQGKAEDAQEAAEDSAEDSEAYAVGTRNGVDVESDDPAYENNAKYYAEEAATVLEDKLDAPATAGTAGQVLTSDGEGGQAWADPSGAIDDTAGEGDTDVTWSADKLAETTGQLLTAIQGKPDIDDTAGIGNTDKAWSADKLGKEFNPVISTFSEGTEPGYYRVTENGEIEEISGAFNRTKVEVQPWMGKYVEFSINGLVGNVYAIYCGFSDENDEYISKNAYAVGNQRLEIPSNAKYIYMSFYGSAYNSDYVIKPNKVIKTKDLEMLGVENPFIDKQGVAFGTSLTYRAITDYGYLQYLPILSSTTVENQGISSARIGTNILPAVKAYTGFGNKDFVIVEGFVNDWAYGANLGNWNDSTEGTVCGCVRSIINYILSQNPKITIFFVLDHYGRNHFGSDCSSTAQINGLTQYEYYEEVAKVCESLGVPVIKQYAESQMSENTPDYFADQIHPNGLGAKHSAYVIWQAMKRYGMRVG